MAMSYRCLSLFVVGVVEGRGLSSKAKVKAISWYRERLQKTRYAEQLFASSFPRSKWATKCPGAALGHTRVA